MDLSAVDRIMEKWSRDPDRAIEMLQDVQETFRYLPEEALRHMADALDIPLHRLYHIGTFFDSFSLKEKGRHVCQVCTGAACQAKGAEGLLEAFAKHLKVEVGGTTEDKSFTLERCGCLGCCSLAAAVQIDGRITGNVEAAKVAGLVKKTVTGGKEAN